MKTLRRLAWLVAGAGLVAAPLARAAGDITLAEVFAGVERGLQAAGPAASAVAAQRARLARSQAAFGWQLAASTGVRRNRVHREQGGFLLADTEESTSLSARVGARHLFENGIAITPGVSVTSGLDSDAKEAASGLSDGVGLGIGVRIPLSRFGAAAEARAAARTAEALLASSEAALEHYRQVALGEAAADYWELRAAQRDLHWIERGLETRREALRVADSMASQGAIATTELAAQRGRLREQEFALDAARQRLILARAALAERLGDTVLSPGAGDPLPRPPAVAGGADIKALLAQAEAQRPDLRAADARVEAAASRLGAARDSARPELDLEIARDEVTLTYRRDLGTSAADADVAAAHAELAAARVAAERLRRDLRGALHTRLALLELNATGYLRAGQARDVAETRLAEAREALSAGRVRFDQAASAADELHALERRLVALRLEHARLLVELRMAIGLPGDGTESHHLVTVFQQFP